MCTISLCMIVKDEEQNIRRCLESAKDAVDEIIIVDTGSSDKTKAICAEFTAKIYDYKWNDNFADARNFSIEKASSDWILWMDADEKLYTKDGTELKEHLSRKETAVYSVKMLHVYGADQEYDKQHYISHNYRLFRNGFNFHFHGAIHEKLSLEAINAPVEVCSFLEILHFGYLEMYATEKALRNLKLLIHEKEICQEDPWIDYYIAAELYRLNDIEKAFQFVNQAIAEFLIQGLMPPALAYKLKYDMLIHTNSIESASKGIEKAIELYPDYVDLHFYRGITLYYLKQYEAAIKAFTYCLILGEDHPNYLIKSGNGSFHAYYYIGECYTKMEQQEFAQAAYQQAEGTIN